MQEGNRPRARRVEVIPVDQLSLRRLQIQKKDSLQRQSPANYDPRPLSMCSVDTSLLQEHLRTDLLNEGSVFTQILVPLVSVALHDHNRYSKSSSNGVCSATSTTQTDSSFQHHHQEFTIVLGQRCAKIMKENLNVTKDEREKIEETTRSQSKSSEWFAARAWRITGSVRYFARKTELMLC